MEVKLPKLIFSLASLFFHLTNCFNKLLLKLILLIFDSNLAECTDSAPGLAKTTLPSKDIKVFFF